MREIVSRIQVLCFQHISERPTCFAKNGCKFCHVASQHWLFLIYLLVHRPHSSSGCFQTGYVLNGQLRWDGGVSAPCPNGPPRGGKWFTAKVEVRDKNVKIFRDGVLVKSIAAHFTAIGRGGVIVANGYKNIIHFKNLRISALNSMTLTSKSCRAVNKVGNLYVMDANHGVWPASGFCRTLYSNAVGSSNYELSVQLYNKIGWKGKDSGHLGLMYNVINYNNFDFVYFRYVNLFIKQRILFL